MEELVKFKNYQRTAIAEMTPWKKGMDMEGISISDADLADGSPKKGDMIARNPDNHDDKRLVAKKYFKANFKSLSGSPDFPDSTVDTYDTRTQEGNLYAFIRDAITNGSIWKGGPSRVRFVEPHYELLVGIGKDDVASMYISKSSLHALGELVGEDVEDLLAKK